MNKPTTARPRLSGQAAIALASAAGVIVAGRMSRPGLLLAAGLAWCLWRREKKPLPARDAPSEAAAEAHRSFPAAPERQESTDKTAWAELRQAIQPMPQAPTPPASDQPGVT